MLAMSPNYMFPSFELEFPISLGIEPQEEDMHLDTSLFLPNLLCDPQVQVQVQAQAQNDDGGNNNNIQDDVINTRRGESPQSGSSVEDIGAVVVMAKKLNHNASERDRRKKINDLYAALRALLPSTSYTKRLSIPSTVARVLKYIPELQKEVEDLIRKKEELQSKFSSLQGGLKEFCHGKNLNNRNGQQMKQKSLTSVSVNRLGEREIVVQISTYERVSLPEVLMLLERYGLLLIDASSSQSFGGRASYNIHLVMEGSSIIKYDMLNEELLSLIDKKHKHIIYFN